MAKILKKIKKNINEIVEEIWDELEISDFFEHIGEEATDFFKNYFKPIKYKKVNSKDYKSVKMYGFLNIVRPAYIFAERLDNLLKAVFSVSLIASALIASFWGFTRLSELIEFLINSISGRILIFIIGASYLLIAVWKLIHLKEGN
jgi:hypothetical protein